MCVAKQSVSHRKPARLIGWIRAAVLLGLLVAHTPCVSAERLGATDPLTQEMFSTYRKSLLARKTKDEAAYLSTMSQASTEKEKQLISEHKAASFQDALDRMAPLYEKVDQIALLPQYVEQSDSTATLVLLEPNGGSATLNGVAGWIVHDEAKVRREFRLRHHR